MTFFVLASVRAPAVDTVEPYDSRRLWLESWDGSQVVPIDLAGDPASSVVGRRGFLGLEVAPTDVLTGGTPGAPGSRVLGVVERERPVALPVIFLGDDQTELWGTVQAVRDLTDPTQGMTQDGNFRLVCESRSGLRYLDLVYRSGLEGEDTEYPGVDTAVLDCLAVYPYARDREEQTRDFRLQQSTAAFLGGLWGAIGLVSSTVGGGGTPVEMISAVPVWPTVEITGPATSVLITTETGLRIDIPGGVAAGSTLRIVTDIRERSFRLDGEPAAGELAIGSTLAPFPLGTTAITVTAPGATSATRLRLAWRGLHRALW